MTENQIVKVHCYQMGKVFTYLGITAAGAEVQLRKRSTRLYTKAYEFDHSVTTCTGDPISSCFLYSGKVRTFSNPPIKCHEILFKGDHRLK